MHPRAAVGRKRVRHTFCDAATSCGGAQASATLHCVRHTFCDAATCCGGVQASATLQLVTRAAARLRVYLFYCTNAQHQYTRTRSPLINPCTACPGPTRRPGKRLHVFPRERKHAGLLATRTPHQLLHIHRFVLEPPEVVRDQVNGLAAGAANEHDGRRVRRLRPQRNSFTRGRTAATERAH